MHAVQHASAKGMHSDFGARQSRPIALQYVHKTHVCMTVSLYLIEDLNAIILM